MKCQLCYHDTDNVSKCNCKFNENPKHLNVADLAINFFSILFNQEYLFYGNKIDIGNNIDILSNSFDICSKNVV